MPTQEWHHVQKKRNMGLGAGKLHRADLCIFHCTKKNSTDILVLRGLPAPLVIRAPVSASRLPRQRSPKHLEGLGNKSWARRQEGVNKDEFGLRP
ncbi:unnamed protein product [Caretta caretta]